MILLYLFQYFSRSVTSEDTLNLSEITYICMYESNDKLLHKFIKSIGGHFKKLNFRDICVVTTPCQNWVKSLLFYCRNFIFFQYIFFVSYCFWTNSQSWKFSLILWHKFCFNISRTLLEFLNTLCHLKKEIENMVWGTLESRDITYDALWTLK